MLGLSAKFLSSATIGLLRASLRYGRVSLPLTLSLAPSSPAHPAALEQHLFSKQSQTVVVFQKKKVSYVF
jgi:hypothetical protein